MLTVFLVSLAAIGALMLTTWLVSVVLRDASIVDMIWGLGFVVVAWAAFAAGERDTPRALLVPAMATLWGLRLSIYLARRNWGKGEDFRYRRMRAQWGSRFPFVSLVTVFGLQGLLMAVISLPLQAEQTSLGSALPWLDVLGVAIFAFGLSFEAIGDWQLARFKANPANASLVMDRGLWRYTRHPNYFGDSMVWWGIFLVCASTPAALWLIVSPIVMTILLTRVSGVPLLERSLMKRRPGYAEYVARTSSFIPLPSFARSLIRVIHPPLQRR